MLALDRLRTRPQPNLRLEQALLRLSDADDVLTSTDIFMSAALIGASGSGKTSGVLSTFVAAGHKAGASIVHVATKPHEPAFWLNLARRCGRTDVRVLQLGKDTFNPLEHERVTGRGLPGAHERMLAIATAPLRRRRSQGGEADGGYWHDEGMRFLSLILIPFLLTNEPISYAVLYECLNHLPGSRAEARSEEWRTNSSLWRAIEAADKLPLTTSQRQALNAAARFAQEDSPRMPSRTRLSVISTVVSAIHPLTLGEAALTLNAAESTWSPAEVVDRPSVLILDAAIQTYGPAAADFQRAVLTAIEREILRRPAGKAGHPVLLALDEGHYFIDADEDAAFITSCRDRRAGMIFATQTCANVQTAFASSRDPRSASEAFLGGFGVRIFCASNDPETLEHASRVFTHTPQARVSITDSGGSGREKRGRKGESAKSGDQSTIGFDLQPDVAAHEIAGLRTGGPDNNFIVEAFIAIAGRRWKASRRPSLKVSFPQVRASR